jgi:uncharacterized protein YndB with AHSA1/START domain
MPERRSQVAIRLRPIEDGTELTLTHAQFFDEAARDAHQAGWSTALDKLGAFMTQLEDEGH